MWGVWTYVLGQESSREQGGTTISESTWVAGSQIALPYQVAGMVHWPTGFSPFVHMLLTGNVERDRSQFFSQRHYMNNIQASGWI